MVEVRKLAPEAGAEIVGANLALDDAARRVIYRAFPDNNVFEIRDQTLSIEKLLAFGRCFGELKPRMMTRRRRAALP
jgi:alpha-ketoglutarate-dependent taurine dioxygenase